jgi:hypothetical protein
MTEAVIISRLQAMSIFAGKDFMTKVIWAALGMAALMCTQACHPKQTGSGNTAQAAPASDTLASATNGFLQHYYSLKAAFSRSDTAAANAAAHGLDKAVASFPLQKLKDEKGRDSAQTAIRGLQAALPDLQAGNTILDKRRQFAVISNLSWQLVRAVGLKGGPTVYRDFCPMFNDGKGAYWLSASTEISNPYYGASMPDCGQVADTLRF